MKTERVIHSDDIAMFQLAIVIVKPISIWKISALRIEDVRGPVVRIHPYANSR